MPDLAAPSYRSGLDARLVEWRRDFHMHPELGFEEHRTAARVAEILAPLEAEGLEVRRGVAGTGLLATLTGGLPGPCILVRADMDALPILEADDGRPYRSRTEGVMHACGHDGHTAILLGLAHRLWEGRASLRGTVKLAFQPAEEGPGGAAPMIADGVLDAPKVDAAIGLHLWSHLPAGTIGVRSGPIMAATDQMDIRVEGRGGHGAKPQETVDAIVLAAQVVSGLQTLVSRNVDPLQPAVVTLGTIHGGFRHNVIAPEVTLTGTVRTYAPELQDLLEQRIRQVVEGTCSAHGGCGHVTYTRTYPATVNHSGMTRLVAEAGRTVLGAAGVVTAEPSMGGEDMAYFLEAVPGSFFFLGAAPAGRHPGPPHHSPDFDIDESALPLGVSVLESAVRMFLESPSTWLETD